MTFQTPEKIGLRLQPGYIAMHSKWQYTDIHRGLKELFTGVKVLDLKDFDFILPEMCFKYLTESRLVGGFDSKTVQDLQNVILIGDRNTLTAQMFSLVQENLLPFRTSLLPVGHMKEVPLLLYQLHLADTIQSPGSNFRRASRMPPNVQQQLLKCIPGVGPVTITKLIEGFGTVDAISHASVADMVPFVGITAANKVYKFFNDTIV